MASLLTALNVPFVEALFIALVSAITSGIFLLIATWVQVKHTEQLHDDIAARQLVIQSDVKDVKKEVVTGD